MVNNAMTQYDRVEYSSAEGVEGFYYKLDKMASRMIERPSDYSFRLRLYEGLPGFMICCLNVTYYQNSALSKIYARMHAKLKNSV